MKLVISLGSNWGDREKQIRKAIEWLNRITEKTISSSLYETPCVTGGEVSYINAVFSGESNSDLQSLSALIKEYEMKEGRDQIRRLNGEVPIDIDIVMVDNQIIKEWDYRQHFFKIGYEEINIKN